MALRINSALNISVNSKLRGSVTIKKRRSYYGKIAPKYHYDRCQNVGKFLSHAIKEGIFPNIAKRYCRVCDEGTEDAKANVGH